MNIDEVLLYIIEWTDALLAGNLGVFPWGRLLVMASFCFQGTKVYPLGVVGVV